MSIDFTLMVPVDPEAPSSVLTPVEGVEAANFHGAGGARVLDLLGLHPFDSGVPFGELAVTEIRERVRSAAAALTDAEGTDARRLMQLLDLCRAGEDIDGAVVAWS